MPYSASTTNMTSNPPDPLYRVLTLATSLIPTIFILSNDIFKKAAIVFINEFYESSVKNSSLVIESLAVIYTEFTSLA